MNTQSLHPITHPQEQLIGLIIQERSPIRTNGVHQITQSSVLMIRLFEIVRVLPMKELVQNRGIRFLLSHPLIRFLYGHINRYCLQRTEDWFLDNLFLEIELTNLNLQRFHFEDELVHEVDHLLGKRYQFVITQEVLHVGLHIRCNRWFPHVGHTFRPVIESTLDCPVLLRTESFTIVTLNEVDKLFW